MRARRWCVLATWVWCSGFAQAALQLSCPPDAGTRCVAGGSRNDEHIFYVDGEYLRIEFREGSYFAMKCGGNLTLDNPALPRFESKLRVAQIVLQACPVPSRSYVLALHALDVEPSPRFELRGAAGRLAPGHLAGLGDRGRLDELVLQDLRLAPDAFDATPRLDSLRLVGARPAALERLPASLRELQLIKTGVERLDRAALARFPNLTALIVRDDGADVLVEPLAPLAELAVQVRAVRVAPDLPPSLVNLTLYGWAAAEPAPWSACAGLRKLTVEGGRLRALPARWLARCAALSVLVLRAAPLTALAPDALHGARDLRRVTLTRSPLRAVPVDLLRDALSLAALDLSENRLRDVPGGLFTALTKLTKLNLARNELTNEVFEALSGVDSLQVLRLDHNVLLGDACDGGLRGIRGTSKLMSLKNLSELYLRNTSAAHVCRDWRAMRLADLDLRDNRISELAYPDLQFSAATRLDLSGNRVTRLLYSDTDFYEISARCGEPPDGANVTLTTALRCDCTAGWAARALRACPRHVRLWPAPTCSGGARLDALDPDELQCDEPCAPAPCRCGSRAAPDPARPARPSRAPRTALVVRVTCERANLSAPPPLVAPRAAAVVWELRLAHNRIASVRAADLPPRVRDLDLRHNRLEDPRAAAALLVEGRRVWLADNPLRCDCDAAAALVALERAQDGPALACAAPADCASGPRTALLPLLALPAALALGALAWGALAWGARGAWRARLKAWLRARGWLARPAEADERPYDAFLSFSHRDEAAAGALLAGLEGGAAGGRYRVCVHYRDWAPGGWIPAQIAASVARSRRTVAVVSAHFLRSGWARAEFRAAYGAALRDEVPRLVVVLLDEPGRLPLDAELRRYLATNTYLRWGDPWFWDKLRAALPPPRGPAPPGPAPPGPAPPPAAGPPLAPASAELLMPETQAAA